MGTHLLELLFFFTTQKLNRDLFGKALSLPELSLARLPCYSARGAGARGVRKRGLFGLLVHFGGERKTALCYIS